MDLKRKLSLRYTIALSLIAIVLIATYFIRQSKTHQTKKYAYIINISGMQRMLSQRIALMAREIFHEEDEKQAKVLSLKMKDSVKRMEQNLNQLVKGILPNNKRYEMTDELKALYFEDADLNKQVQDFLSKANSYLTLYENKGLSQLKKSKTPMLAITNIARNGLVDLLDRVVTQYQKESESKVNYLQKLELILLLFGLIVLILEVQFIFRPMTYEIIRNTEKFKTANRELLEFSYRISHDLKAPIVSTLGLIHVLEGAEDLSDTKRPVAMIKGSMNKLSDLVTSVINLTKIKQMEITSKKFNLKKNIELIFDNVSKYKFPYEVKRIQFSIEGGDFFIIAKETYLTQCIHSLISNAIKYSDRNKKNSFIKIKAEHRNGLCYVSVIDNGVGIHPKHQSNIFSMFNKFHSNITDGSGLGLYLAKQNILAMGGDIRYTPRDEGCKFSIQFPAQVTHEQRNAL